MGRQRLGPKFDLERIRWELKAELDPTLRQIGTGPVVPPAQRIRVGRRILKDLLPETALRHLIRGYRQKPDKVDLLANPDRADLPYLTSSELYPGGQAHPNLRPRLVVQYFSQRVDRWRADTQELAMFQKQAIHIGQVIFLPKKGTNSNSLEPSKGVLRVFLEAERGVDLTAERNKVRRHAGLPDSAAGIFVDVATISGPAALLADTEFGDSLKDVIAPEGQDNTVALSPLLLLRAQYAQGARGRRLDSRERPPVLYGSERWPYPFPSPYEPRWIISGR